MNVKNQQLLWDLYAGTARDVKKTSCYYENNMRVLQGMLKKTQQIPWDPYAGIVTNEGICRYYKECKMLMTIMGFICRYCNEYIMSTTILKLICGYCIFENLLMEFIIKVLYV
jgi:hypothetical protein